MFSKFNVFDKFSNILKNILFLSWSEIITTAGKIKAIPKASKKVTNSTKIYIKNSLIFFSKTKSLIMSGMKLKIASVKKLYLYV